MQDQLSPQFVNTIQDTLSEMDNGKEFVARHIGPSEAQLSIMLDEIGVESLAALIETTVPRSIANLKPLNLGPPRSESEALEDLRTLAKKKPTLQIFYWYGLLRYTYPQCDPKECSSESKLVYGLYALPT